MKLPEQNPLIEAIDKASQDRQEPPRGHLGASMLGHPCDRWLWLSFRWAVVEKFDGRLLRLFRRGHNEEATVVSDLRNAGIDVRRTGNVDFGSHVSGSLDGIIFSGVPEAPAKKHVLEIKTHSLKSFKDLVDKGVEKSKPIHMAQIQLYMHGTKTDRALYVAVCKDNDEIYTERVRYVKETAEKLVARGHRITGADRMPEPLSADPSWYQCKFCAAHDFCHGSKLTKEANCRTCCHSTAKPDSTWHCAKWDDAIPHTTQRDGCENHILHPDLVPWKMLDSDSEDYAVWEIDGKPVKNGEYAMDVFSSSELIANPKECANPCDITLEARKVFFAKVIG